MSGWRIATFAVACPEQTTSLGSGAALRRAHGSPCPQTLTSKLPALAYACVGAGVDFPETKGIPTTVPSPKSIAERSQDPVPSTENVITWPVVAETVEGVTFVIVRDTEGRPP